MQKSGKKHKKTSQDIRQETNIYYTERIFTEQRKITSIQSESISASESNPPKRGKGKP